MENNHRFIIGIPTNVSDLEDPGASDLTWEEIKWDDFEISSSDYALLFDLFTDFNLAFGIIIDEYEDEIIPADKIGEAIALTKSYKKRFRDDRVQAADRLLAALIHAKELNKPVELFF